MRGVMSQLFGEKLRYLRHQQAMTQVELARRVGLSSYTHVTKLEAGQRAASLSLIVRLADVLGVTTDYLLSDTIGVTEVQIWRGRMGQETDSPMRLLGSKLRTLRSQHSLKQSELAQRLGIAQQAHISKLENGQKEPSLELIVQIANLFDVATDYLLRDAIPVNAVHS